MLASLVGLKLRAEGYVLGHCVEAACWMAGRVHDYPEQFAAGLQPRAELARQGKKLPLLGEDDSTADRNYIREFLLAGNRELGRKYGVEYAEAFHYIGPTQSPVERYVEQHAIPLQ